MSPRRGFKRPFKFKNRIPNDPAIQRMGDWPECNQEFYQQFYSWLGRGGYAKHTATCYGTAARDALGLLHKPYWEIDSADLARVYEHLAARTASASVREARKGGLDKLDQYLAQCRGEPERASRRCKVQQLNWPRFLHTLPDWLAEDVRVYLAHCRKSWRPSEEHQRSMELLSKLTTVLRSMASLGSLQDLRDLTPNRWEDHVAARLADGIGTVTLNSDLLQFQKFLRFLAEGGRPICQRMLRVKLMPKSQHIPRDVPVEQLRRLLESVEQAAANSNATTRALGVMDRAWILLMLHSGLRTGEIRRLRLGEIDWENRRIRIEQSKGLKDRLVPLSVPTIAALRAYLGEPRLGTTRNALVFGHWHQPLNDAYCRARLLWYQARCGVQVSPHQLRHSAATLLLNAGAPVLTVQLILGHKKIDTTLGYARLYDGTAAADYYRAMVQIESHLSLAEEAPTLPPNPGELVALVDSLRGGTLNQTQVETLQLLRSGILAVAEREAVQRRPNGGWETA
jgi:integrase/recombinase XerC